MSTQGTAAAPDPLLIFDALNAYQKTAALKAGVELDIFTHIAEGGYRRGDRQEKQRVGTGRAHPVRFSDDSRLADQDRLQVRSNAGFGCISESPLPGVPGRGDQVPAA